MLKTIISRKIQGTVRVGIESKEGISDTPARVVVYVNNQLIAEIVAEVELKRGANFVLYHCVTLKKR